MSLFFHNPPNEKSQLRLLTELFVGRSRELRKLRQRIPGDMAEDTLRLIHGQSRVGKSHLALRFLTDLRNDYHVFIVKAASGRTARQILSDLFQQVRKALQEVTAPMDLQPEGVSSAGILTEGLEMARIFDGLIVGDETAREITYSSTFEATRTYKVVANILGLTPFSGSSEVTDGSKKGRVKTRKISIQPPNDYRLVDIIRELCELLNLSTGKQSILYIDDVDLLDDGPDVDQAQVNLLIRLLAQLAESQVIAIVASARTRHMTIHHKTCTDALRVPVMKPEELKDVYRRHISTFSGGAEVFDDECLTGLVEFATGHVGNFLRTCAKFLDWADLEGLTDHGRLLTVAELDAFLISEVQAFSRSYPNYMDPIRQAVQSNQTVARLEPAVLGTPLVYTILEEPDSSTASLYEIRPLVARILRKLLTPQQDLPVESSGPPQQDLPIEPSDSTEVDAPARHDVLNEPGPNPATPTGTTARPRAPSKRAPSAASPSAAAGRLRRRSES